MSSAEISAGSDDDASGLAATLARAPGAVGRASIGRIAETGRLGIFAVDAMKAVLLPPYRPLQVVENVHFIGTRSLPVIVLAASFTGMVLALQGHSALARFGTQSQIGPLVALSLARELAPVMAAIVVAARTGSSATATIGNMRTTEQLDALRTMAVRPMRYLVAPRVLACAVALPLITTIFFATGLGAGYLFATGSLGADGGVFWSGVQRSVEVGDLTLGLYKSLLFGLVIALISTFNGFYAQAGAGGVGKATTRSVVEIITVILMTDYILTALIG